MIEMEIINIFKIPQQKRTAKWQMVNSWIWEYGDRCGTNQFS